MHGGFECTSRIFLCLYYQTEEIACVPFSLIKKCKSITPVPPTAPPNTPTHIFSSFLSHGGICDERALLMWSCRNPFQCQLHRFLCRTASDEFACFKKKFVLYSLLFVHMLVRILWHLILPCLLGAWHAWEVHGAASGIRVITHVVTKTTAQWAQVSLDTVRSVSVKRWVDVYYH